MRKDEAKFQILFKHWVQAKWQGGSASFELKRSLTNRFYIPDLAPHQEQALLQAKTGTLYHKISDSGIGQKPFDCFILQKSESYVVIAFENRVKEFYLIPILIWVKNTVEKTSVTDTELEQWGGVVCILVP